jgi:hypothetical protein
MLAEIYVTEDTAHPRIKYGAGSELVEGRAAHGTCTSRMTKESGPVEPSARIVTAINY